MRSIDRVLVLLTAGLVLPGISNAAALTTESFTSGLNGWTNGNGEAQWVASSQALRASFAGNLLPQSATIEAGAGASGGAFSDSYSGANIEVIGFSFFAENILPSVLKLEIRGGTNVIFQDLLPRLIATTGNWNYVLCPLIGPSAARWNGAPLAELPNILTNVSRVAIRVTTSGPAAQAYRLDDLFLDQLPAAAALSIAATNRALVTFTNLRTNFAYRVQTVADITGTWTNTSQLTATNRTAVITVTNAIPSLFYRLEN